MAWIKLHNKFIAWEWFAKPEMVQLFVWLLLKAASRDTTWQGIAIKRGQVLISQRKLAAELGLSYQQVRTCLQRLQTTGEVVARATHQLTLVTISNYDSYQAITISEQRNTNATPTQDSTQDSTQRADDVNATTADSYTNAHSTANAEDNATPTQDSTHIYKNIDNIVVVEDARTREEMIEALRRDLYASPLKMESALRATRVHDVTTLRQLCEEVFADWQLTNRGTIDWPHLRNQLIIKAEARRREEARLAAIPKPQQTVKEWRQQLAADVMKGVALNQALNNKKN
jgi:biotin operon repressor